MVKLGESAMVTCDNQTFGITFNSVAYSHEFCGEEASDGNKLVVVFASASPQKNGATLSLGATTDWVLLAFGGVIIYAQKLEPSQLTFPNEGGLNFYVVFEIPQTYSPLRIIWRSIVLNLEEEEITYCCTTATVSQTTSNTVLTTQTTMDTAVVSTGGGKHEFSIGMTELWALGLIVAAVALASMGAYAIKKRKRREPPKILRAGLRCPSCGAIVDTKFCTECGKKVAEKA